MKVFPVILMVGGVGLVGLGSAMAIANPDQKMYERYATVQITNYVKTSVCSQGQNILGNLIQQPCNSLVETVKPQIQEIVIKNTQRQDYIFFSIYYTNLSLGSLVPFAPSYQIETVGAFNNFYSYLPQKR
jgi:uncharacterized protein YceK